MNQPFRQGDLVQQILRCLPEHVLRQTREFVPPEAFQVMED